AFATLFMFTACNSNNIDEGDNGQTGDTQVQLTKELYSSVLTSLQTKLEAEKRLQTLLGNDTSALEALASQPINSMLVSCDYNIPASEFTTQPLFYIVSLGSGNDGQIVKEQTFINESGDIEHIAVSIYETRYTYCNIKISGDFEQNIITKFGVTLDSGQMDGEGNIVDARHGVGEYDFVSREGETTNASISEGTLTALQANALLQKYKNYYGTPETKDLQYIVTEYASDNKSATYIKL
ncbi:MAG: hypothetical protein ACI4TT_03050, partial [Christensenellales bacterium]